MTKSRNDEIYEHWYRKGRNGDWLTDMADGVSRGWESSEEEEIANAAYAQGARDRGELGRLEDDEEE
jgi:hypothetical protein